ncbi:PIN domain-containing protein [Hymenobacter rubripertinctus]|uniref:PIN domain-containing protein n=1 Tax=Hymenobacter rubripertinctus TaxID=2029981 RepID=UPI0016009A6E|nr:PIN domain-containing protein [Hymenobacter rubripertinctus]
MHYLKGEHALEAKVTAVGLRNCFISELTIAEMLYGLAKCEPAYAAQQRQYITKLQRLFNTRLLPMATAFELYGPEKVRLLEQVRQGALGKYPGELDVLIACSALAHQLALVTRNTKDFAAIVGLPLENWIDNP